MSIQPPTRSPRRAATAVFRIRLALVGAVLALLALVFAVPRQDPPPTSLEQPGEAFIDRVGLVSGDYAREMAAALQRDSRFQMAVLVDARPPDAAGAGWTTEQASAWRIGAAEDNGLVLFVFREPRVARVEVGYGLEAELPDVLVRRLLAQRLAPRFATGDFEGGIDALVAGVGEALGGEAARHRLWAELGGEPRPGRIASLLAVYAEGWECAPRTLRATWGAYLEGGPTERVAILIVAGILLAIALAMVAVAATTLRAAWRRIGGRAPVGAGRDAHSTAATGASGAFELVFGLFAVALMGLVLMFAMALIGEQLHRQGEFSGAGAQVIWADR